MPRPSSSAATAATPTLTTTSLSFQSSSTTSLSMPSNNPSTTAGTPSSPKLISSILPASIRNKVSGIHQPKKSKKKSGGSTTTTTTTSSKKENSTTLLSSSSPSSFSRVAETAPGSWIDHFTPDTSSIHSNSTLSSSPSSSPPTSPLLSISPPPPFYFTSSSPISSSSLSSPDPCSHVGMSSKKRSSTTTSSSSSSPPPPTLPSTTASNPTATTHASPFLARFLSTPENEATPTQAHPTVHRETSFLMSVMHWCSPYTWIRFVLALVYTMVMQGCMLMKKDWERYPLLSLDGWQESMCVKYFQQPRLYLRLHLHCWQQRVQNVLKHPTIDGWKHGMVGTCASIDSVVHTCLEKCGVATLVALMVPTQKEAAAGRSAQG